MHDYVGYPAERIEGGGQSRFIRGYLTRTVLVIIVSVWTKLARFSGTLICAKCLIALSRN